MVGYLVLHTIIRGEGRQIVVLLHGFLGSGRNLSTLGQKLLEANSDLKIFIFDHLGHGRSPELPPQPSLEVLAEAVWATLDAQGVSSPVQMVGHSMGGRVALVARRLRTDQVTAVHLLDISPGPIPNPSPTEPILRALREVPQTTTDRAAMGQQLQARGISRPLAEWLLMSGTAGRDGFTWRIDREALAAFHAKSLHENLWEDIFPQALTTLQKGQKSPYVSEQDMQRLTELGVSVSIVPNAGHFLHAEQPDEVAQILSRSIKEI